MDECSHVWVRSITQQSLVKLSEAAWSLNLSNMLARDHISEREAGKNSGMSYDREDSAVILLSLETAILNSSCQLEVMLARHEAVKTNRTYTTNTKTKH